MGSRASRVEAPSLAGGLSFSRLAPLAASGRRCPRERDVSDPFAVSTRVTVPGSPVTSSTLVPSDDGTRTIPLSACGPSATGVAPGVSETCHDWNTLPDAVW